MSKSSIGWRKAGISSLATAALVAGACVAGAGAASATTNFGFQRLAGANRYDTAVQVSQTYGNATNVILADGEKGHFPDALVASYLAGIEDAPILLTHSDSLADNVAKRISDMGATDVWIVGGTGVVSQSIEDQLSQNYNVHRIDGLNRYATDAAAINAGGKAASDTAIVTTGVNFPDAVGASPLSYAKGLPLAITKPAAMSQDVLDALQASGVTKAIILGGDTIVTPAVEAQLKSAGITVVQRIAGTNRADTSAQLAQYEIDNYGFTNKAVNVASGYAAGTGADALSGGPLSGLENRPTLVTFSDTKVGAAVLDFLQNHANTEAEGFIFGGPGAVSDAAQTQMEAAAQEVTSNQSYSVSPSDTASQSYSLNSNDANTPQDDTTQGARSYSATGLDDTKDYVIALFPAENVDTSTAQVKFADTEKNADGTTGNNVADWSQTMGFITSVNNQGNADANGVQTGVKPVNGVIKFTINAGQADQVIPVVFTDAAGGTTSTDAAPALDLNKDNTPSDPFGIGGETDWVAPTASNTASATGTVTAVDKDANTVTFGAGALARTYSYDSNDSYAETGNTPPAITMDTFEANLSRGDTVKVEPYYSNSSLSSSWTLTDSGPAVTSTATEGTGSSSNDVTVSITPVTPSDAADYSSFIIQRTSAATPQDSDYKTIATISPSDDADANTAGVQYQDNNLAAGTYSYRVAGVVDGEQGAWSTPDTATTTTPGPDQTAPTATDTRFAANNGLNGQLDQGDVFKVVFDEAMAAPKPGATLQVEDGDSTPTIANLVNGTNATFTLNAATEKVGDQSYDAGQVVTVTLTGAPSTVQAGSAAGVQNPADIVDSSGITDVAGNRFDIANSADVTIDQEKVDQTAPVEQSAAVTGQALTLTYNEALDTTSVPATSDFNVQNGGAADAVTNVSVTGKTVVLTLTTAPANGAAVTVSYTKSTNPIQDLAGNDAANLTNAAVTNNN